MSDKHDGTVTDATYTANYCRIVRVHAIAVQFLEVGRDDLEIVLGVGPHGMSGHLGNLPGRKLREDVLRQRLALVPEPGDLLIDIDLGVVTDELQLLDLRLEFGDRLLKI